MKTLISGLDLSQPRRLLTGILWFFVAVVWILTLFEMGRGFFESFFPLQGNFIKPNVIVQNEKWPPSFYEEVATAFGNRYLFDWGQAAVSSKVIPTQWESFMRQWQLKGILFGRLKQAIFLDKGTGSSSLVTEGQSLGGVEVKAIESRSVRLKTQSGEKEVSIEK